MTHCHTIHNLGPDLQGGFLVHLCPRDLAKFMLTCKEVERNIKKNPQWAEYWVRVAAHLVFTDIVDIGSTRFKYLVHVEEGYKRAMGKAVDIIDEQIARWAVGGPPHAEELWSPFVNASLFQKTRMKLIFGIDDSDAKVTTEQAMAMSVQDIIKSHVHTIKSSDPVNAKKLLMWVRHFAAAPIPTTVKTGLADELIDCFTAVVGPFWNYLGRAELMPALELLSRPTLDPVEVDKIHKGLQQWTLKFAEAVPLKLRVELAIELKGCFSGTTIGVVRNYLGRQQLVNALGVLSNARDLVVKSDSKDEFDTESDSNSESGMESDPNSESESESVME